MRGFQSFLRGVQRFRSSQRPSERQISSRRLSVLLPLIALPLELSPTTYVLRFGLSWEEPSMDQRQSLVSRKLSTNFQRHRPILILPENKAPRDWSIRMSPEIHMDQWLPNLSESSGLLRVLSATLILSKKFLCFGRKISANLG